MIVFVVPLLFAASVSAAGCNPGRVSQQETHDRAEAVVQDIGGLLKIGQSLTPASERDLDVLLRLGETHPALQHGLILLGVLQSLRGLMLDRRDRDAVDEYLQISFEQVSESIDSAIEGVDVALANVKGAGLAVQLSKYRDHVMELKKVLGPPPPKAK